LRRLGVLVLYWVLAGFVFVTLFISGPFGEARLLAPLGRVLLVDRPGGWSDLRSGRRWAEAVGLTLVWGGVPWLVALSLGPRLAEASIQFPWMPGADARMSGAWWWVGPAVYFGLLHRRVLAGLVGGAFALLWQWTYFSGWNTEVLSHLIPSDLLYTYLSAGLAMGVVMGVTDFLAGYIGPRLKSLLTAPNRM
jgi:hypothetical protein